MQLRSRILGSLGALLCGLMAVLCFHPSGFAQEVVHKAGLQVESFRVDSSLTMPVAINDSGVITGYYQVPAPVFNNAFLRFPDGNITTFAVPNAIGPTTPAGVNNSGVVAGTWVDSQFIWHGFVRALDGTLTSFDPPGSARTVVTGINGAGTVTGWFLTSDGSADHGFVRTPNGEIKVIVVDYLTQPAIISDSGAIAGSAAAGCFVRATDGTVSIFNGPGTSAGACFPKGINDSLVVSGYTIDANSVGHGFVRDADGNVTSFDAPGAGTSGAQGTFTTGMDREGDIVGTVTPSSGNNFSFFRATDGTVRSFQIPGAQYTAAFAVNAFRVVTGIYSKAGVGSDLAFVLTPTHPQ